MTKYEVRVTQIYRDYYHIEAKNEEEAKELINNFKKVKRNYGNIWIIYKKEYLHQL